MVTRLPEAGRWRVRWLAMRNWMPSRPELVAEIIVLAGTIGYNLYQTIASGRSPAFVFLSTIAAAAIVLFAIASWESIAQRLRRRVLSGKELIDTVDHWLSDNNYTRGPFQWEGYSYGLQVSRPGGPTVWIGASDRQSVLAFIGQRSDFVDEMGTTMTPADAARIKLDLDLEVARIGALVETRQNPYTILYSVSLTIDAELSSAQVLDMVMFIERVDFLVTSLYLKNKLTSSPAAVVGTTQAGTPSGSASYGTAPAPFPSDT